MPPARSSTTAKMPRRLLLLVLVLVVAVTTVTLTVAPQMIGCLDRPWAGLRAVPAAVAGQPVPAISEVPAARLAVAGDTGTGSSAERATAEAIAAHADEVPYDGLLLLGDLIYEDGALARLEQVVTEPFAPVLATGAALLPVLGNHDYRSGEQQQIMAALGRDTPWYVERLGPLRVVVLDSDRVQDPDQTEWLRATLAEPVPAGTWTVAAMHHPAYSAGQHGSDTAVRRAWSPLFSQYRVRLVLAGHDHDYQRSTPQNGVTYVVSGGGAKLRCTGRADFTAVSASVLHYVDLLVYGDQLVGRAIDQNGRLVDTFTITR